MSQDLAALQLVEAGENLVNSGDVQGGIAAFTQALRIAPDLASAHNNLGVAHWIQQREDLALEHLETALTLDPHDADALLNYLPICLELNQPERAVAAGLAFLARHPDNEDVARAMAVFDLARTDEDKAPETSPKCLFINTYYTAFLDNFYRQHPTLADEPYERQLAALQDTCFGDSDFYSRGLRAAGWQATDYVVNCTPLQQTWARENGSSAKGIALTVEQVRRERPQVVYMQDLSMATREFLAAIRPYTELIVGQIASPLPAQTDVSGLDIIFSSFPHFVERFRQAGIVSYFQPLAFEPQVLEKLPDQERDLPVTFVGGISAAHGKGRQFLEDLANQIDMEFWGYGADALPPQSAIRSRHNGEAWGLAMFSLLAKSRITINRHIDVAEHNANNMRLFEATGCGALLITDYKDNLDELFKVGQEVVAYRSPEECAALVRYYQSNPEEARQIARAGQARTLRDHTYGHRMKQTAELLARHLRYRREQGRLPVVDLATISTGKVAIDQEAVTEDLSVAWKNADIPARQRALTQHELAEMYNGRVPQVFHVMAESLFPLVQEGTAILEVGCSTGYYYEILEYLLNKRIDYTGVDYSEAFVQMARDYYPKASFLVADGASLPFFDNEFPIAISSCVLLHVPNYAQHIKEIARVAERYVVAHRTPVCRIRETQYYKKRAYGVETVELRFNEAELLELFEASDLKLIDSLEFSSDVNHDQFEVNYIFRKSINRL